ncbi:MAG: DUF790 family protein [Persicimonas sp.]
MLTSDLVRTRVDDGEVVPLYLETDSEKARAKAEELIFIFEEHRGGEKGEVDEAVDRAIGHGTDYLIWRGLAKLLYDRSEFETVAAVEPAELRRVVFERAATQGPVVDQKVRKEILTGAADELELQIEEVEQGLYADLDERQRLVEFDTLEPLELLHRYNLALAQAVLYKATRLDIKLGARDSNELRYLFQTLKFNRLMHRIEQLDEGYRLRIDGPASLFKSSRKYGLRMATFLPALVLLDDWSMVARLDWDKNADTHHTLRLSSEDGLVSHYSARGQWIAEEERYFEKRFEETDTEWELERQGSILELADNQVIVPDYLLSHPDGDTVYLEVVGFWRLDYLKRRIQMLVESLDAPLVLVVSERLKTGRQQLESAPAAVVFFKSVILVDRVLEAAEAVR